MLAGIGFYGTKEINGMKTNEEESLGLLLVGFALGLVAGVLWAPPSGRDTRRELRRVSRDKLSYLIDEAERLRDGTDHLADSSRKWLARLTTSSHPAKTAAELGSREWNV